MFKQPLSGVVYLGFGLIFGFDFFQTSREIDRALRIIGPPLPDPSPTGGVNPLIFLNKIIPRRSDV